MKVFTTEDFAKIEVQIDDKVYTVPSNLSQTVWEKATAKDTTFKETLAILLEVPVSTFDETDHRIVCMAAKYILNEVFKHWSGELDIPKA